jgi:hypothetical protein
MKALAAGAVRWLDGAPPRPLRALDRPEPQVAMPRTATAPSDVELKRRRRVALGEMFNAAQPVGGRDELRGRSRQIEALTEALVERRNHALIFGPRGSGKTSLARVFGDLCDEAGFVVVYLSSSGDQSFQQLMRPYLDDLPADLFPGGRRPLLADGFTARDFAGALAAIERRRVILVVDEFDRIVRPEVQHDIANLLKFLADMRAGANLLLVGIARNVDDLLGGHPSLRRHVAAVAIGAVEDTAILALIEDGARRSGVAFEAEAQRLATSVALGSPYHARLFCHAAGLRALAADRSAVTAADMRAGIAVAYDEWAMLNHRDAARFAALAAEPAQSAPQLAALAAAAAATPRFTLDDLTLRLGVGRGPAASVIERLGDSLVHSGGYEFDDPLAPQFLAARLMLDARPQIATPIPLRAAR